MEADFRANNGFHKQKKSRKLKNTVFTRQKFWFHKPEWRIHQKIYVFTTQKSCFHQQEYLKIS